MEVYEIEAVLEKIWDLHDKLSDAIHSISRTHFLNSVKDPARKSCEFHCQRRKKSADDVDDSESKLGPGFVIVKEFQDDEDGPAVQEAKSLYAIRTALENLEDQLEFFHTLQTQQRIERESAMARLEQSRTVLAARLAEHQGKQYNVIEEAQALVGYVRDAGRFVAPEHLFASSPCSSGKCCTLHKDKRPNAVASFVDFVTKPLKLDGAIGIVGNAALLALSMTLLHVNQQEFTLDLSGMGDGRKMRKSSNLLGSSDASKPLDVTLARG